MVTFCSEVCMQKLINKFIYLKVLSILQMLTIKVQKGYPNVVSPERTKNILVGIILSLQLNFTPETGCD